MPTIGKGTPLQALECNGCAFRTTAFTPVYHFIMGLVAKWDALDDGLSMSSKGSAFTS